MSNKDDNSLGWFKSEEEKQNYINRVKKNKEARENQKNIIPKIPYFIQSAVYILGATLYQTNYAMLTQLNLSGSPLSFSEQFGIAFWVFGVPSWVMLSIILYLIERKKPKEKKSNVAFWMGIGFFLIFLIFKN